MPSERGALGELRSFIALIWVRDAAGMLARSS